MRDSPKKDAKAIVHKRTDGFMWPSLSVVCSIGCSETILHPVSDRAPGKGSRPRPPSLSRDQLRESERDDGVLRHGASRQTRLRAVQKGIGRAGLRHALSVELLDRVGILARAFDVAEEPCAFRRDVVGAV